MIGSVNGYVHTAAIVDLRTAALKTGLGSGSSCMIVTSDHSRILLDLFTASMTAMTYCPSSKVAAEETASLIHPLRSSTREKASLRADTYFKMFINTCGSLEFVNVRTMRKSPLMYGLWCGWIGALFTIEDGRNDSSSVSVWKISELGFAMLWPVTVPPVM